MMTWQIGLIAVCILLEIGIVCAYRWAQNNTPEYTPWVILGSKVVKMLAAIVSVIAIYYITEIEVTTYAIWLIVCYLISIVIESVLFLKKKQ
ncbi:MAG: hypothetical protein K6E86_03420 [Bacteroidales bacterium]|nr:hypothetical protein [Bacteroidales bacterium]